MNLMCGKKRREMADQVEEVQREEQALEDSEVRIEKESDEYKMRTARLEAELARARKSVEIAAKNRMDLQRELKHAIEATAVMRSAIIKNEDNIKIYRRFDKFLGQIAEDREPNFRENPLALVDEFQFLEQDNMFVMQCYEALQVDYERKMGRLGSALQTAENGIAAISTDWGTLPKYRECARGLGERSRRAGEDFDREIHAMTELIRGVYISCFGRKAEGEKRGENRLSAMAMLEHLETSLEDFHKKIKLVSPAFAMAKQRKKDEERMEQRKLEAQARKIAEQQLKVEQALARASTPRKHKTGRPMVRRTLPIRMRRVSDQLTAEQIERERLEKLLFEEDED
jgi:hypothetical protein